MRYVQVRAQLHGPTGISKEQILRLSFLIVAYWLIFAFLICYRIYVQTVKVEPLRCLFELGSPSVTLEQGEIEDATAEQVACSAATGEECPLSQGLNKGAWYVVAAPIQTPKSTSLSPDCAAGSCKPSPSVDRVS
jgi:hypothetical protein